MVIVDRIVVRSADEFQDRAHIDLGDFLTVENDQMIGLFKWWRDERIGGRYRLPTVDAIRWEPIVDLKMHQQINLIDVSADNPDEFRIETQATLSYARSKVNLRGVTLREFPDDLHRDGLRRDFQLVKERGAPRYHDIVNQVGGRWRAYRRIILPFAGPDGRGVEKLMIGVRIGAPEILQRGELQPA